MPSRFYHKFIQPKSQSDDARRREFIVNVLLLGTIGILFLAILLMIPSAVVYGYWYVLHRIFFLLGTLAFFLMLYGLSRIRFIRLASYILVAFYFTTGVFLLYMWGLNLPQGFLVLSLALVMSSIVLGTKSSFLVLALIAAALFGLVDLTDQGVVKADLRWLRETINAFDAFGFVLVFAIIAIVSWLSNREIQHSLDRARRSEAALKQERDQLEIKVEARTKELKQIQFERLSQIYRLAEFGKLTSGLFHELANPVSMVSLNLEHVNQTEQSLFVKRARQGVKQIEQFVHAAQKQIKHQEERRAFSLIEEIEQIIDILHYRARAENLRLTLTGDRTLQLFGNPIKFTQVMTNLVSNAIDAYASIRPNQRQPIRITVGQTDTEIQVSVVDQGMGIAGENLKQVFEPFFTTKTSEHGTGIGLSISRNIIERDFHGRIEVTSAVGQGSTFIVRIPVPPHPERQERPPSGL